MRVSRSGVAKFLRTAINLLYFLTLRKSEAQLAEARGPKGRGGDEVLGYGRGAAS